MDEPKAIPEQAKLDAAKLELTKPESAKAEVARLDLPRVEAPSLSPAGPLAEPLAEPVAEPVTEHFHAASERRAAPKETVLLGTRFIWPSLGLRPRQKRQALLAASVAMAGALGAVLGASASGSFAAKPAPVAQVRAATVDDHKALEQQLARLASQVSTLKTSLEAANKTAAVQNAQMAKIAERAERIERNAGAELVTGSISAPQTVPAAASSTPLPTPRPAPRIAAVEATPPPPTPSRPQIVQDWAVRGARNGYVFVESRGELFQVEPGAPLPGLGPVQSIKRLDGRWVVTTPKGIIVSMRDRRYFE